ncbi:MAG: hypothetical protein KatS3mg113_0549 [Planctomycetaceae bacterium]|nr:MAG: hypothetical protein KatS3mg113_0549 [Planctomycetaceae bacterium]
MKATLDVLSPSREVSTSLGPASECRTVSTAASHRPGLKRPHPHALECEVHRRLKSLPGVEFSRLEIHRTPGGICIEGLVKVYDGDFDLKRVLAGFNEAGEVINHLITQPQHARSAGSGERGASAISSQEEPIDRTSDVVFWG